MVADKNSLDGFSEELLELMGKRVSHARLDSPSPSNEELDKVFKTALRAPDHMRLRPWRYLTITGDARVAMGELFLKAARIEQSELSETQATKFKNMPLRAPMIIVGIAALQDEPKVPKEEQLISAGVGMGYMLLALQAMGYGGMWRTGAMATDQCVKEGLGLAANEEIIGFLYVGTPVGEGKSVPDMKVEDFVQSWP